MNRELDIHHFPHFPPASPGPPTPSSCLGRSDFQSCEVGIGDGGIQHPKSVFGGWGGVAVRAGGSMGQALRHPAAKAPKRLGGQKWLNSFFFH